MEVDMIELDITVQRVHLLWQEILGKTQD